MNPVKLAELKRQRAEPTEAERVLRRHIRGRKLGVKFRNRHLIAGFFVNFYAPSIRLAIEGDGAVHDDQADYDALRSVALAELRVSVVRVRNHDELINCETALSRIRAAILECTNK